MKESRQWQCMVVTAKNDSSLLNNGRPSSTWLADKRRLQDVTDLPRYPRVHLYRTSYQAAHAPWLDHFPGLRMPPNPSEHTVMIDTRMSRATRAGSHNARAWAIYAQRCVGSVSLLGYMNKSSWFVRHYYIVPDSSVALIYHAGRKATMAENVSMRLPS